MNELPAYLPVPPAAAPRHDETNLCLLATRDDGLADHVALIAAASGVVLIVERRLPDRLPAACTMALLGPDAAVDAPAGQPGIPVILVGFTADRDMLWRAAARDPGARVAILPEASAWLGEYLGERGLHSGTGRVTVLSGASGGAGTTTLALVSALACGRHGARSLVVDADPHSRGFWPLLGRPATAGVGWEDLARSRGQIAPGHLAEILPEVDGTAVLTWGGDPAGPVAPAAIHEVLAAARRTYDVVVVDAGRTTAVGETLAQLADSVVVVASAAAAGQVRPAAPAGHEARMPWRAVVTGRLPAGVDGRRVAAAAGLELLAYVPPAPVVAAAATEGRLGAVLSRPRMRRRFDPLVAWILPPVTGGSGLAVAS